jgi:GTP1/Obg family GTP-binding protein
VSGDPNEIATLGEVQQALTALQQNFATQTQAQQQEFMRQLEVAGQRIREEQSLQSEAAKFSNALDKLLTSEDYKIINDVLPFAQDSLRFQVAQLDPQSMDEAIQMMENIAKEWVGKIRSTNTDYLRRQEVARAQAVMEPSTGSPVPPVHVQPKAGTFLKKDGTMDWNTLRQRALSMLDAK